MENAQGTLTTHGNADNFLLGEAGASNSYNTTANLHCSILRPISSPRSPLIPASDTTRSSACSTASPTASFPALRVVIVARQRLGLAPAAWVPVPALWEPTTPRKMAEASASMLAGTSTTSTSFSVCMASEAAEWAVTEPLSSPILSINADGTLHLIKDLQGLATLEWHGKKLDIYTYTGAEYAARTAGFDPISGKECRLRRARLSKIPVATPKLPPAVNTRLHSRRLSPIALPIRARHRRYARLLVPLLQRAQGQFQFGTQYSYVTRQTWSGVPAARRTFRIALRDWTTWSSPRSATTCRKPKNGPASAFDAGPSV